MAVALKRHQTPDVFLSFSSFFLPLLPLTFLLFPPLFFFFSPPPLSLFLLIFSSFFQPLDFLLSSSNLPLLRGTLQFPQPPPGNGGERALQAVQLQKCYFSLSPSADSDSATFNLRSRRARAFRPTGYARTFMIFQAGGREGRGVGGG